LISQSEWTIQADEKKRSLTRQEIWSRLEEAEIARDAQPARRISMSLPRDLPYDTSRELLRQFVDEQFTRQGFLVDLAVHRVTASDGKENLHAHLLIPIRPLDEHGEFAKHKRNYKEASSDWQNRQTYIGWRKAWADKQNLAFYPIRAIKSLGLRNSQQSI